METPNFNFKKHQNNRINWKMLMRLIVYISVLFILVFFIIKQEKTTSKHIEEHTIQQFEVEIDSVNNPI